jgi:hypothetical protein
MCHPHRVALRTRHLPLPRKIIIYVILFFTKYICHVLRISRWREYTSNIFWTLRSLNDRNNRAMLEAELGACKHLCSGSLILRCTICKYMCVVGFMTCHQLKRNRPTRLHAFQRFRFVVRNTASGQSSSVALCWRHCTQKCNKSSAAKAGCSSQTSLACVDSWLQCVWRSASLPYMASVASSFPRALRVISPEQKNEWWWRLYAENKDVLWYYSYHQIANSQFGRTKVTNNSFAD